MHKSSFEEMSAVLGRYLDANSALQVLDVGSALAGDTWRRAYRELISPRWTYIGADISPGPNVDLVMLSPYQIQTEGDSFDVVISGQCLEHVERPWVLVPEMARMLKPEGFLILTAPWQWTIHRYPLDCWRILPDGMKVLLRDAHLKVLDTYVIENDCWGIGQKP